MEGLGCYLSGTLPASLLLGTWDKEAVLPVVNILCVVPAIMAGALMPLGLLTGHDSQLPSALEGHEGSLEGATGSFDIPALKAIYAQPHGPLISLAAPDQCLWRSRKQAVPVWGDGSNGYPSQGPLSSSHQDVESSSWPFGLAAWDLLVAVDVPLIKTLGP